jgi:hypothetical protein
VATSEKLLGRENKKRKWTDTLVSVCPFSSETRIYAVALSLVDFRLAT